MYLDQWEVSPGRECCCHSRGPGTRPASPSPGWGRSPLSPPPSPPPPPGCWPVEGEVVGDTLSFYYYYDDDYCYVWVPLLLPSLSLTDWRGSSDSEPEPERGLTPASCQTDKTGACGELSSADGFLWWMILVLLLRNTTETTSLPI